MPKESAAPIVMIESTAKRFFLPDIFNMVSPSSATCAVSIILRISHGINWSRNSRGRGYPLVCVARRPRGSGPGPRKELKFLSAHSVIVEFLDNIRVHRLGVGNIQIALRNRAIALLGEPASVQ